MCASSTLYMPTMATAGGRQAPTRKQQADALRLWLAAIRAATTPAISFLSSTLPSPRDGLLFPVDMPRWGAAA